MTCETGAAWHTAGPPSVGVEIVMVKMMPITLIAPILNRLFPSALLHLQLITLVPSGQPLR